MIVHVEQALWHNRIVDMICDSSPRRIVLVMDSNLRARQRPVIAGFLDGVSLSRYQKTKKADALRIKERKEWANIKRKRNASQTTKKGQKKVE